MKTLYITFIIILLTSTMFSQQYLVSNTTTSYPTRHSTSLSSFVVDVIDDTTFNYREFLNESSNSPSLFRIGSERISKKELTKILRKGSRKSEDAEQFENYLFINHPRLSNQLTMMEFELLFDKFSQGTLSRYVNELPSVL